MSKTFKKLMLLPMLAAMMVLMPTACTSNDNPVDDNTTVIDPGNAEFNPTVLTGSTLYVADGVDADLHQAFKWGCGTESSNPEDGWVLVLNKLTDVSEDVLKKAIVDGGYNNLICLVNPVKAEIDAYAESHDWFNIESDNVNDNLFIFGFNSAGSRYVLLKSEESEDIDPIVANMERNQKFYVMISAMLSDYASLQQNGGDSGSSDKKDLENFAGNVHFMVGGDPKYVLSFYRQAAFSDPDYLFGCCYMTATYDVYMAHVYEGQPGAGDYYAVKMVPSVASKDMWKGKGDKVHGGVHVRWCGAYCTEFYVESRITPANLGWDSDTSGSIILPAGGWPSPQTAIGQEQYTDQQTFSLNMSQTVGASKTWKNETSTNPAGGNAGGKSGDETTIKGELAFSEGWSWSHSKTRYISDVDILNNSYSNRPTYGIKFNNLPEFKMSETNHYDEGKNVAARTTMDLQCSWVWYDKNGKDNENKPGYKVRTLMRASYEIQSHYTTEADNIKTATPRPIGQYEYQLPQVENSTGGHIKIKNTLPDGMLISNIVVTMASEGADKGKTVSEYRNSVANGDEYEIGFFNNHYEYLVTFKAGTNASTARTYKYIANPSIKLGNLETVVLNASYDFVPE